MYVGMTMGSKQHMCAGQAYKVKPHTMHIRDLGGRR